MDDDADCDTILDLSVPAMIQISPDSSTYVYSEDDPLYIDPCDRIVVPPLESEEPKPDLSGDDMGEYQTVTSCQILTYPLLRGRGNIRTI